MKPIKDNIQPDSYKAINLLLCLEKLMENVNCTLVWWLENHDFQLHIQYRFHQRMSTIDCLIYLENVIQGAFHDKHYVTILSTDFQSVFDSSSYALVPL